MNTLRHGSRARLAAVGVAASGALLLAGCGAANEAAAPPAGGDAPAASRRLRHHRRRRRHLAAGRAWRPGSPASAASPRRHRQLRPHRLRCRPHPVHGRRGAVRRQRRRPRRGGAARRAAGLRRPGQRHRAAAVHLADRGDRSTWRASTPSSCRAGTIAKIFNRQITTWNDPAIAADNPGVQLPATDDHPGEPLRRVGHHRELHRVPGRGRRRRTGRTSPTASGRSRAARPHRAPRVSSARSRAARAPSATPTLSQAGDLGKVDVKVGGAYVDPTPEAAAAVVEASPRVEGQGQYNFAVELARDTTAPAPTRSCWCPTRSPAPSTRPRAGRHREGLPRTTSPARRASRRRSSNAGNAPISDAQRSTFQPAIDAIAAAG